MKNYLKPVMYSMVSLLLLAGCDKDENKVYLLEGTSPALTANTSAVQLTPATQDETAIVFSWTNPNYKFTTGISSHDVVYTLEMDTAGSNFSGKNKYVTTIAKELSKSYTENELNNVLGNSMRLETGRQHTIEVRIKSSLGSSNAAELISNVSSFTATPFAPPPKVPVPVTSKLYIVGDATAGGWTNPVPVPSQEFTKISDTEYEIEVDLIGGKSYLFLPENGSWSTKYSFPDAPAPRTPDGGAFEFRSGGGQDFLAPAASGTYRINVNFQVGEFTVTKI